MPETLFAARFGRPPAATAAAPGRLNLIGEHTDYNGGLVLPAAIEARTRAAVRFRADARVCGISRERGEGQADLADGPRGEWLDYARGVARALEAAGHIPALGFELAVESDVPAGAGLSSSAALEVSVALALKAAAGSPLGRIDRLELARLCRAAEAEFVGVPCGLMDPFCALHAERDSALLLDCSSLAWEALPLPAGLRFVIADTGVRHDLRAGDYAARRAECERALERARKVLGRELACLSRLGEADLEPLARELDPVAFRRARHVVRENARVRAFADALRARDRDPLGPLLEASHESLRADFEVTCAESDFLVEAGRGVAGALGARMTGAGFGGCTLHLVEAARADAAAAALARAFAGRFGRIPRVWRTRACEGARAGLAPAGRVS